MLQILLAGCHGRMGRQVAALCAQRDDLAVSAGLDQAARPAVGFPVFSRPGHCLPQADVLIDFSQPDALDSLLHYCIGRRLPAVLAVTGYSKAQLEQIAEAAKVIPVFRAANLSLGANILLHLTRQVTAALGPEFDAVVTERHHRSKKDAPSGTAFLLSQAVSREAQIFSIRAGATAGEHTVLFVSQNEMLELTHRADSREVYALGAVRAAQFIARVNSPGLYGMDDLLN